MWPLLLRPPVPRRRSSGGLSRSLFLPAAHPPLVTPPPPGGGTPRPPLGGNANLSAPGLDRPKAPFFPPPLPRVGDGAVVVAPPRRPRRLERGFFGLPLRDVREVAARAAAADGRAQQQGPHHQPV